MRKDRNAFFEQSSYNSGFFPNPQYGMPSIASTSSESYYQGPNVNQYTSDIDSRLAKLERQINRLESRISRLESNGSIETTTNDYNPNTNMYMV